MKNVKWLSKIELVNYDYRGYWEKEGWSDSSVIPTMFGDTDAHGRKTDTARQLRCRRIAFAGRHGISRVQVSSTTVQVGMTPR